MFRKQKSETVLGILYSEKGRKEGDDPTPDAIVQSPVQIADVGHGSPHEARGNPGVGGCHYVRITLNKCKSGEMRICLQALQKIV